MKKTALVLSGGGARGAYEVGVLRYLRKSILKDRHGFALHCGTSGGALNTCFLAAHADTPAEQGELLAEIWRNLRSSDIYRGDIGALSKMVARVLGYTTSHLFGISKVKNFFGDHLKPFQGLLDTSPFIPFLKNTVDWNRVHANIANGPIDAVAIATTNIGNGKTELFIDKKDSVAYTGAYRVHFQPLEWMHAMASAAIPVIFPPVRMDNLYYVDGSVRLNTPMSPAVQLGADKVFIIGVKHRPLKEESGRFCLFEEGQGQPTLTHLVGKLLNTIFLDHINYDLEQMNRINRIVEWSEQVYGTDYVEKINTMLKEKGIQGDIANRGLKKIESFALFPSEPIGKIATEKFLQVSRTKKNLTQVERFFLKFVETEEGVDVDLLSYLMFDREYLEALMDLGYHDAQADEERLGTFLSI